MKTIALVLVTVISISGPFAFSQPGSLDSSFHKTGMISTPPAGSTAYALAIQSDGKIVAVGQLPVGNDSSSWSVTRYNTNGTPDKTFGLKGQVITDFFPEVTFSRATGVAIQSDGKIIVAGFVYYYYYQHSPVEYKFALARYNPNGSLDTTFATSGKELLDIRKDTTDGIGSMASSLFILPNGKILVAGYSYWYDFNVHHDYNWGLVRLNSNGSLDKTFGKKGAVYTSLENPDATELGFSVVSLPSGKILVGGSATNAFAVVRYSVNGVIDSSFGVNGVALKYTGNVLGNYCKSIAVQQDGKILAAGQAYNYGVDFGVVRFTPDGITDSSFGLNGVVITDFTYDKNTTTDQAYSVLIQPDSKIILVGDVDRTVNGFGLVRYKSNGTIDSSFGTNGKVITKLKNGHGYRGVLQPDGKIVTCGASNSGFLVVARYNGDNKTASTINNSILNNVPVHKIFLSLHPNPSTGVLTVEYQSTNTHQIQLNVYDAAGKEVFAQSASSIKGNNTYQLDLSNAATGVYYLELNNASEQRRIKFVIQR